MRNLTVARAVAWRTLHNVFTNPALVIPQLAFPLFFFTAFAGGLSRIRDVPGFSYPEGYTAFQFVFVLLQASAFGGVFTGFGIAADFESGFGLTAPARQSCCGFAVSSTGTNSGSDSSRMLNRHLQHTSPGSRRGGIARMSTFMLGL